jgi:diguanylate cyclase (GGDEF)-like protein
MWVRRRPVRRLLRLTSWQALVLLGAVAVVAGFVVVRGLQQQIETRAQHSATSAAQLISALVVDANVAQDHTGQLWISTVGRAAMDAGVERLSHRGQLVGLEVWAMHSGHLVYADPGHPAAEATLPADEAVRARRGAFVVSSTGDDRSEATLDVFIPYDFGDDGIPEAVVEVLLPHDTINESITRSTRLLYGGAGVVAVLGALVVGAARRRHRRQEHAARHDPLTGLGNRMQLAERAAGALAAPDTAGRVALLVLDLDRFKEINDTLGHHTGDDLLAVVARRLQDACRADDTVTRLGGDEFAVLLRGLPTEDGAATTARRLLDVLREPIAVSGLNVEIDASIGVALAPDHGTELDTLLRCADVAMYDAKRTGADVTVYDPQTDHRDEQQLTVLAELRHAIGAGQLRLYYQPKCAADGSVSQVEALLRWQHPDRGLLPPAAFLPLSERTALIRPLTAWVLHEAARQCAAWRAAGRDLSIAVNVSPRNLVDDDLPRVLLEATTAVGLPASALQVEITETAVMTDPTRAARILTTLRSMGVSVSIDDFGAGYTSLSQLAQLPVHTLKIDRQFVGDLLDNPAHEAIIRNVAQLARDLDIVTVAEGVESHQVWTRLIDLGCDEIQGHVLTPPLPPDRLLDWIAGWPGTVPTHPPDPWPDTLPVLDPDPAAAASAAFLLRSDR